MRLSIRLQNHGKKNHPYWWIVVAPQHKNIFGTYTEHIGFWSPRHNVNIKRQIILNIPRLMYWLGNGAVPTYKVHKFLNMFGVFPKQWKYVKSVQELAEQAKKAKPYEQMSAKQKSLVDRKKKREERQELHHSNYHRYEAYAMRQDKTRQQLMGKQQLNEFQNQVIRDMLHQQDFVKYDRLAQLSGNNLQSKPYGQQLNQIRQKLRKYRSELAMLQRHYITTNTVQKSKLISIINSLSNRLTQLQDQSVQLALPEQPTNDSEFMTTDYLQKRAKYELITKTFERTQQQLKDMHKLFQPITVSQLALKLKQLTDAQLGQQGNKRTKTMEDYYQMAQDMFVNRNREFSTFTRFDLLLIDQKWMNSMFGDDNGQIEGNQENWKFIINEILKGYAVLPTLRPVHPRPDLKSYIPEQHFDPIDKVKLDVMMIDSLQPHQELQKYKRKRNEGQTIEQRKARDLRKRMQRLRLHVDQ